MTLNQFYAEYEKALRETGAVAYRSKPPGVLRFRVPGVGTKDFCFCPVTLVAYAKTGERHGPWGARGAGEQIGLSLHLIERIIAASDASPYEEDGGATRTRLVLIRELVRGERKKEVRR